MERANRHNSKREKIGKKGRIFQKNIWKMMTGKRIVPSYLGKRVNNEFLEDKWDQ